MESKLTFYQTDCETILSHLKHQDYHLQLKRRWLMGFPMSKSEKKKLLRYKSLPESFLREDDIFYDTVKKNVEEAFGVNNGEREDKLIQETKQLFERTNLKEILLSCLDALTNKGLFLLAMLLTRGSINFEKTRPKMKKVIKESIPGVSGVQNHKVQIEIFTQLCQLLKDQRNVRDDCLTHMFPTFHSHHISAIKILNRLEELSTETLLAMRRKLRGDPAGTPRLRQTRHGLSRDKLIYKLRRTSEKMLSELIRGHGLQVPLSKALAVAGLSLKLTPGYSDFYISDFDQFSPEIKSLQNEITKAIWLLKCKTKVRIQELKTLQLLLDPNANVPNACLRTAMKKMLTEYLFECSDLDTIPKSLLDALAVINRSSRSMPSGFLKDEIDEEVDCILSLSAQMKQVVWDLLPDHELEEDFSDVYMEELEESDDDDDGGGDNYDHHDTDDAVASGEDDDGQHLESRNILSSSRSYSIHLDNLEESCGEYVPEDFKPSFSNFEGIHDPTHFQERSNIDGTPNVNATQIKVEDMEKYGTSRINGNCFSSYCPSTERLDSKNESEQSGTVDLGDPLLSSSFCSEGGKFMSNGHSASTNLYLGIQEVCDEASMVAYNLIGCMMEKFAEEEGLDLDWSTSKYLRGDNSNQENPEEMQNTSESVIVRAVEELVPSLPKSGMEKLKELMGIL
eukprot:XP_015581560.1 uncharacterized protein LOC8263159 isoform X1 [Ricinus communis]